MKWLVVAGLMCFSTALGQTGKLLTLEDALAIGRTQSRLLQVSAAKADAASARADEVGTLLLPSLKLEGIYRRLSDVDPFQVSVPFSPQPIVISPTILNNYNVRVGLQQPIFTGFKLRSNARAAEYLANAAAFDNKNDASELDLNIISAYWTLYQTLQTRAFVDENVARLTNYEQDTERLMSVGMATRNDLLKIQVQLSSARLTQIDATNDVRLAMMNLNNVIGQPLETQVQPASEPAGIEQPQGGPLKEGDAESGSLVMRAFEARPDLHAMKFRVQATEASVTAAKGAWWPQLFLGANYYYARPNSRYLPARDEFKSTWDVGLTLQFDLWNWGATSYQTEQAAAQLHQNELLYAQMKDNISLEVTRATLNVDRARKKVAVAQLAIEQADENVRTTTDKYKNGLATSSDLLDADVALLQTKTSLSASKVEYALALARLNKATGQGSSAVR